MVWPARDIILKKRAEEYKNIQEILDEVQDRFAFDQGTVGSPFNF
jgi:hypothetical protein